MVALAATVPATLYLFYVFHYSINVPNADDWNLIPLVVSSIHGHLMLGALWGQYIAGRAFVTFSFITAFGVFDHLNEKAITLFSAACFVASYALLLFPFRSYLGRRRLTFLPVLSLGIVWFSLADVENALWAVQLVAYLVVFFFAAMTFLLLVPRRGRNVCFALGIVVAIAASCSFLEGFVLWPVGLICLVWFSPWGRRTYLETAIWISAAVITMVIYFHGYNFAFTTCTAEGGQPGLCSSTYGFLHPVMLIRYFVVVLGNVMPSSLNAIQPRYLLAYEALGTAIAIVAVFVIIQSIRERQRRANPLPLLLIVFALSFDLLIVEGHLGEGLLSAGIDRFPLPNIILLVGIVVYAWGHVPKIQADHTPRTTRAWFANVGLITLAGFLVVQCVETTQFGIAKGNDIRAANVTTARVVVNLDRIPSTKRACYFQSMVVGPPIDSLYFLRRMALRNRLSVFQPSAEQLYRAAGPPTIRRCEHGLYVTTTSLPHGQVGVPYSATLTATGGNVPYGWYVLSGRGLLPQGLTLDTSTGSISGTPELAGTSTFSVTAVERETKSSRQACWTCSAPELPQPYVTYRRALNITIS